MSIAIVSPGPIFFGGVTTDNPMESSSACLILSVCSPGRTLSIVKRPAESVTADRFVPLTVIVAFRRYPPRMLSTATPAIVANAGWAGDD
jgi:hypothetical protein